MPPGEIAHTIVLLGKPYDNQRISQASSAVAAYLNHLDPWVRHEVLWFLGSWGELQEYLPQVRLAMEHDADADNRQYAAVCIGRMKLHTSDPSVLGALGRVVENGSEEDHVRVSAYFAMLRVSGRERECPLSDQTAFDMGMKSLQDINFAWVTSVLSSLVRVAPPSPSA